MEKTHRFFQAPLISPKGFFLRACGIVIVFWVLSITGCQKYVGALFGTSYSGTMTVGVYFVRAFGIAFGIFYFASWILAPILLLASGLFYLTERFFPPQAPGKSVS